MPKVLHTWSKCYGGSFFGLFENSTVRVKLQINTLKLWRTFWHYFTVFREETGTEYSRVLVDTIGCQERIRRSLVEYTRIHTSIDFGIRCWYGCNL